MRKYLVLNGDREVVAQLIEGVHDIPAEAVVIDAKRWYEVTQDISCVWHLSDADKLTKRPRLYVLSEPANFEREWRNQVVASTEWLVTRHRDEQDIGRDTTLTAEQFAELLLYRQALRDWPESPDFPGVEHRPVAPAWIADQAE
ncbi:phage tail assembly chaperone [Pseudomonas sp. FP2309]|uniref:phage tail assembly chaperone n=1 Tax=Pseudomonas sp. FP2309 TaxID=2954091 RepID=UPI002732A201|nr:phage tail assembly chaperone [Pseudomonas sp. FP2309]WLH69912.1 phage tail assembly chaperone [Pseudomonas sp. FP2309]